MRLHQKTTSILAVASMLLLIYGAGCSKSAQDATPAPAPKLTDVTPQGQAQQQTQQQQDASLRASSEKPPK